MRTNIEGRTMKKKLYRSTLLLAFVLAAFLLIGATSESTGGNSKVCVKASSIRHAGSHHYAAVYVDHSAHWTAEGPMGARLWSLYDNPLRIGFHWRDVLPHPPAYLFRACHN